MKCGIIFDQQMKAYPKYKSSFCNPDLVGCGSEWSYLKILGGKKKGKN